MKTNEYYKFIVSFNKPVEVIDQQISIDSVLAKDEDTLYRILKKEYLLDKQEVTIITKELVELFKFDTNKREVFHFKQSSFNRS
jgi:hypothetical protein